MIKTVELVMSYVDTAPAYANSEETLGRILEDLRVQVLVSTKLGGHPDPLNPRDGQQLSESVHESWPALKQEVIDMLFVHEPDMPRQCDWWSDPGSVYGPVIDVLERLKTAGTVRFTGLGERR